MVKESDLRYFKNHERQVLKLYTLFIDRWLEYFFDWYTLITNRYYFKEIAFCKEFTTEYVYLRVDKINNIPIIYIDTPEHGYVIYFYLTVGPKKRAIIYKTEPLCNKGEQTYDLIRKELSLDNLHKLVPLYHYSRHGKVDKYPPDPQFHEFVRYLIEFDVPIYKEKITVGNIQINLEKYYLDRHHRII